MQTHHFCCQDNWACCYIQNAVPNTESSLSDFQNILHSGIGVPSSTLWFRIEQDLQLSNPSINEIQHLTIQQNSTPSILAQSTTKRGL